MSEFLVAIRGVVDVYCSVFCGTGKAMSMRKVSLEGGSPWGFRMHGGADVQQPLRISRVSQKTL